MWLWLFAFAPGVAGGTRPSDPTTESRLLEKLVYMETAMRLQSSQIEKLVGQVQALEAGAERRQLQAKPADTGTGMRIHKRKMTSHTFKDTGDRLTPGGGHRRNQEKCSASDINVRLTQLTAECCNEPGEDCSGSGFPHSCNEACGSVVLTFWKDCRAPFSVTASAKVLKQFQGVVDMCEKSASHSQGLPLSQEFSLSCSDPAYQAKPALCIPECGEELHGDVLLATVDGNDSSFACETRNGLYSWVGKASSGGYIGEDFRAFIASIMTAAGGVFYLLSTEANAGVGLDLSIEPYQKATIRACMRAPLTVHPFPNP
eukprot:COSAG05_NODE_912_length_6631_cov_192.387171_5_plen_316_part_00